MSQKVLDQLHKLAFELSVEVGRALRKSGKYRYVEWADDELEILEKADGALRELVAVLFRKKEG